MNQIYIENKPAFSSCIRKNAWLSSITILEEKRTLLLVALQISGWKTIFSMFEYASVPPSLVRVASISTVDMRDVVDLDFLTHFNLWFSSK